MPFRLAILESLARQLAFAPIDVRTEQLAAAETLLYELDPARSYPPDFVIFRITGYAAKGGVQSELLTGLALQHDLCLLIESVSAGMKLSTRDVAEPVLSIDDVTARFNVTSKTIQRWRRKGLVSRRFIFADGKSRVGFLLSSIERFIHRNSDAVVETSNLSAITDAELAAIVRQAERLVARGSTEADLTRRIARNFRRSPLTILHTLRKHDALHPESAVLNRVLPALPAGKRAKVLRAFKRGWTISRIARRIGRTRASVYRELLDDKLERLGRRRMKFHDDELYHADDAEGSIRQIVGASLTTTGAASREELRIPSRLPPYIADLYRTPLFTPAQERAAFLEFNWRKFQFVIARRAFDPETARWRDVEELNRLAHAAGAVKNRIVAANLRLVVSVARRHAPGGLRQETSPTLMELVSEGNLILMRAAESFDIHKNVRFSTYATFALMKGFARLVPELRGQVRTGAQDVGELDLADRRSHADHIATRDEVAKLMKVLSEDERRVIKAHFGLEPAVVTPAADRLTYDQLGHELGMTRHRVRQLERSALAKLRGFASTR